MTTRVIDAHVHVAALPGLKLPKPVWRAGFPDGDLPGLYGAGRPSAARCVRPPPRRRGGRLRPAFQRVQPSGHRHGKSSRTPSPSPSMTRTGSGLSRTSTRTSTTHCLPNCAASLTSARSRSSCIRCTQDSRWTRPSFTPSTRIARPRTSRSSCTRERAPSPARATGTPASTTSSTSSTNFPGCTFVLAHGGRGWSFDTAAFLALSYDNVWIDIAGLPPRRLPDYYARHSMPRLARQVHLRQRLAGSTWDRTEHRRGQGPRAARRRDLGRPRRQRGAGFQAMTVPPPAASIRAAGLAGGPQVEAAGQERRLGPRGTRPGDFVILGGHAARSRPNLPRFGLLPGRWYSCRPDTPGPIGLYASDLRRRSGARCPVRARSTLPAVPPSAR